MIKGYKIRNERLEPTQDPLSQLNELVWVDLIAPTADEEKALETILGINIPTREEMEEIEISSRLYYEDETAFMTAVLPTHTDRDDPSMSPVSFVLAHHHLITVRYEEPRAFVTYPQRSAKSSIGGSDAETVLVSLLEAIVDRLADVLERAGRDVDRISTNIFQRTGKRPMQSQDLQKVLEEIGRKGDLISKIRDTLVTLERVFSFLAQVTAQRKSSKDLRARIKTLTRDAQSLSDHDSFLSQKITFLLDASLGMINIEQNAIIKIFSVAAVVFLPPTLIASIYGMNFTYMPELEWMVGYPFALILMVISAILPFVYFRYRGWL